jgi:hypothetical protein
MKHEFRLDCPGCGEHMLSVTWDAANPHVRKVLREIRKAERGKDPRRKGQGPKALHEQRRAKAARAELEAAVVGDVLRREQAARLTRHPERHEHHCGAVVLVTGDPFAPLGRRVATLRGRGRPDEAPGRGSEHGSPSAAPGTTNHVAGELPARRNP